MKYNKTILNALLFGAITALIYIISKNVYAFSTDPYYNTALYPPINPLNTYYIKVSEIHTVYYSTFGNPLGIPVLFIHGGPGGGTTNDSARFFNPDVYFIVLVDQRGCGKSTPLGELRENTTQNLIEDFEKIRKSLMIQKWQLFGGSWGSTLSLAYAITYPQVVTCMVLRGVFLSSPEEINWIYQPNGISKFHPDAWTQFKNALGPERGDGHIDYVQEYNKCFKGEFGDKTKRKCLENWSTVELSAYKLHPDSLEKVINDAKQLESTVASIIENHYLLNNCFLEPEFFFKRGNIDKIKDIPTIIVQGQYDLICPPVTAQKLHKMLNNSTLHITIAGHTMRDEDNIKHLVQATNTFSKTTHH